MLGDAHHILVRGIAAAKAGDQAEARRYLERLLLEYGATRDEKARAHLWLTELTDDLLLLPFWIANYRHEDNVYTVVINGQTGQITGQKPAGLLKQLFSSIFK